MSKKIWLLLVAVVVLVAGTMFPFGDSEKETESKGKVSLAYVEWDTEIASTNVVAEVLRVEGYDVTIVPLDNAVMWESVASGQADGMVSAWLPGTHQAQYEKYSDKLEDLGVNCEGAKIGLVVPAYMEANSIGELSSEAAQKITGIEPGAGVVAAAEKAVATYGNLSGWEVVTSSTGAMNTALAQALKDEEEIIITGWSPHWMFAKYDLKYLEDPEGVFGGEEYIGTMVRKGLKEDMPKVYSILDNFKWDRADIEAVMVDINGGMEPLEAAKKWIKANPDKVKSWTK